MDAVLYVNQTYTETLKAHGRFDEAAQKEAFQRAYAEALKLISENTKEILEEVYGSFVLMVEFPHLPTEKMGYCFRVCLFPVLQIWYHRF